VLSRADGSVPFCVHPPAETILTVAPPRFQPCALQGELDLVDYELRKKLSVHVGLSKALLHFFFSVDIVKKLARLFSSMLSFRADLSGFVTTGFHKLLSQDS